MDPISMSLMLGAGSRLSSSTSSKSGDIYGGGFAPVYNKGASSSQMLMWLAVAGVVGLVAFKLGRKK